MNDAAAMQDACLAVEAELAALIPEIDFEAEWSQIRSANFLNRYGVMAPQAQRRIFVYWDQGWANAPEICRVCADSWQTMNPEYSVQRISFDDVKDFLGPEKVALYRTQTPQVFANLLRLELILDGGGTWADATAFCAAPMINWLPILTQRTRTFMFAWPSSDRPVDNWFIYGVAGAPVLRAWMKLYRAFIRKLSAEGRRLPYYFTMHAAFRVLLRHCPDVATEWAACPVVHVGGMTRTGYVADLRMARRAAISQDAALDDRETGLIREALQIYPMQKLTWTGGFKSGTPRAASVQRLFEEHLLQRSGERRPGG